MKQSNIISFFEQAKIRKAASTSSLQYGRVGNREKLAARDIFTSKDPSMIYQKLLKKEQQQFKVSAMDIPMMEGDHSSQNSSQLFPNSQNSLSHIINSSESNDTPWMQEFGDNRYHPSNQYRSKQMRNFRYSTNSNVTASVNDINQYFDDFKRRAKEKDDREMIATFITLVKECCEETKAAVNASCVRCEGRVTEGVAFVLEKVENASKKLENMESLVKTKDEYEEKVLKLELQLQEKSIEIANLRRELAGARDQAESKMMEKVTEVFDQGQKVQSEKIEELVSKASDIHTILKKPKIPTADMWSQYSPRLDQPATLALTNNFDKTNPPVKSMQLALPPCFPNENRLHSTIRSCSDYPLEPHRYLENIQHQQPTSNLQLSTVTQVTDNLAVEPTRSITTGMPSTFKPVSYYGFTNSHHFAMKSPMPQRRVAFGNMKKDSPVIAVRPFIQDLSHSSSSTRVCNSPAAHLTEQQPTLSTANTTAASWEVLANSQQNEWFSRSTRSTRKQASTLSVEEVGLETQKMPPPKVSSRPVKGRRSKRKKSNFTRTGPSKRTKAAQNKTGSNKKLTENATAEVTRVDNCSSDTKVVGGTMARGPLSIINTNTLSVSPYTTDVKQENVSPLVTPFRLGIRALPSNKWSTIVDSDADSTGTESVILYVRSDDKENKLPPSDSDSIDWAGF